MVGHDPEGADESEESEYVSEQNDAFRERQVMCEEDVECDCQGDHGKRQKRCLPECGDFGFRMDQKHHFLDDACELDPARGYAGQPAQTAAPADDVGEAFLITARRELPAMDAVSSWHTMLS